MITRNYDALVVHPSPGALIAAAMLARDGMSVVVLEDEGNDLGAGSFRFQRHSPPVTGFGEGMLLSRTLRALKFHPHELQALRRTNPGLQVITNRHRLDIPNSDQGLVDELAREYPSDFSELKRVIEVCQASAGSFAEALDAAVEDAGQTGLFHTLGLSRPSWNPPLPPRDVPTWGEFIDGTDLSSEARALMNALVRPFCALDVVEDLPLPVAGIHLRAALDGVYSDPSEEHPFYRMLLRRVRAMRVDVVPDRLEAFTGGRRKIQGAIFEGSDEEMPLDLVISGGDPEDLLDWLPKGHKAYDRVLSRLAPSHFRYSIFLGVASEVVPADLCEQAILLDHDDPEGEAGTVLMTTSPAGSPMAPDGFRSITASTLLPYEEDGSTPKNLDKIAGKMVDKVKWLMPYLERNLELLQIPTSDQATDDNPMTVDPTPVAYTPAIAPSEDPVAAGLGVFLPHRNVFCAGPAAFPTLGLGGEVLAGRLVERLGMAGVKKDE